MSSTVEPTRASSTSVLFATPLASLRVDVLAGFTAQSFFFVTDLLKSFYSGFGLSETSVEPQLVITDPVVRLSSDMYLNAELNPLCRSRRSSPPCHKPNHPQLISYIPLSSVLLSSTPHTRLFSPLPRKTTPHQVQSHLRQHLTVVVYSVQGVCLLQGFSTHCAVGGSTASHPAL